jgi:NAD(P)-dependent dehydrogenase (short-subunit alcohol dehydrogenase family)
MSLRFDNRVAIVTGAGNGLGRSHALALAARGAKVVINDLGGARDGTNASATAAQRVVDEIRAAGGEAMANAASVTDEAAVNAMVAEVMAKWGRIDILVNNAGILRDKTFAKMDIADFRTVVDVHLMGAVICTKAVWEIMRNQKYGRIVMTTSSTGLYGNFGQSNYAAAKMALVGFMQTLALEGAKYDIRVNSLAPTAATRMTEDILPPEALKLLQPEAVTPGVLWLVSEDAPTRQILCAGGGSFEVAHVTLTQGINTGLVPDAAEKVAALKDKLVDRAGETVPGTGFEQAQLELNKAGVTIKVT